MPRYHDAVRPLVVMLAMAGCGSSSSPDVEAPAPVLASASGPVSSSADAGHPSPSPARGDDPAREGAAAEDPGSSVPLRARKISTSTRPGLVEFADALESEGALWIGQLPGNGGRDVAIFVPPGTDPHGDFRLVVHFHGTYSENVAREQSGVPKKAWVGWNRIQQTIDAMTELQARGDVNVALVYPISAGKRMEPEWKGWSNKMYDRMWMTTVPGDARYTDDFEQLLADATEVLSTQLGVARARIRPQVLAEGHSAGGIALRNVAAAGTTRVEEYVFLDASFQDWADGCFDAVRSQRAAALVTLVITDGGIADPFGNRDPWCTELESASRGWPGYAEACEGHPQRHPAGASKTCEQLERAASAWPDYAAWCEGLKNDMEDEPGVFVFRTKVPHGKQPRHFGGGLGLPATRMPSSHEPSPKP